MDVIIIYFAWLVTLSRVIIHVFIVDLIEDIFQNNVWDTTLNYLQIASSFNNLLRLTTCIDIKWGLLYLFQLFPNYG